MLVPRKDKKTSQPQQTNIKPTFESVGFKTYMEEAIEVLNMLENKGVDVYADGRFGGMEIPQNKFLVHNTENREFFLKQKSNDNELKNIFKQ